jgi:hypothetical protein
MDRRWDSSSHCCFSLLHSTCNCLIGRHEQHGLHLFFSGAGQAIFDRPYYSPFGLCLVSEAEEIDCDCEEDAEASFWKTKTFLGIVTVFAFLLLAFSTGYKAK